MINRGGQCNRLERKVTLNETFSEAVKVPASVNQTKNKKIENP